MNPAIKYTKEMKSLFIDTPYEAERWNYLYKKCRDECTHKHSDGSSSWNQFMESFKVCDYCSWN